MIDLVRLFEMRRYETQRIAGMLGAKDLVAFTALSRTARAALFGIPEMWAVVLKHANLALHSTRQADVALLVENRDWSRSGAGLLGARADSCQLVNPPNSGEPSFLPTGRSIHGRVCSSRGRPRAVDPPSCKLGE
jgi:hypothetical protein